MKKSLCVLSLLALQPAFAAPPSPSVSAATNAPQLKLPANVHAVDYDIHLKLVPGAETYSGEVVVNVTLDAPSDVIWLNGSADLTLEKVTLNQANRPGRQPVQNLESRPDFIGFRFSDAVSAGRAELRIAYRGRLLRHEGVGLFTEHDGADDYIYTDFEPIDARRAFPCFDEPSQKVPVRFTLDVPAQHVAASNAPIESETPIEGGLKRVVFRRTPPLPTYLWALAVGPFGVVDAGRAGSKKIPLRILTLRGREAQARYAASVSASVVDALEKYTGVPFPYEKLDQIAVPNQQGAMENAGLITYGQRIILLGPESDTVASRRRFLRVCAHEIGHHWTGDLVTLRFWDDLWLNESFASFLDSKITEKLKPEWGERFDRIQRRQDAMEADSLLSARRIRQPIQSDDDIVNAFDPITYAKGQSVLTMIESWLGEAVFQRGLTHYLTAHANQNATAEDFVAALVQEAEAQGKRDEAAALPKALSSFLDQPGVPVVSVALDCAKPAAPLRYRQRRYLPLGTEVSQDQALLYRMPLCLDTGGPKRRCAMFEGASGDVPGLDPATNLCAPQSFVQVDPEETRYARLHYEGPLFDKVLGRAFPTKPGEIAKLSTAQQLALLLDLGALLKSGDLRADQLLPVTARAATVPGRYVVSAAARIVHGMPELAPVESRPRFAHFVRQTFGPRLESLGLRARPGEDEDASLLRATLLPIVLGDGDVTPLQKEAEKLLLGWLGDRKSLDADSANALAVAAPQHAGPALWEAIYQTLKKTTDRNLRGLLFDALGAFRDPALSQRGLLLLTSGEFETREAMRMLMGVASHVETRQVAYDFVKQNFQKLVDKLPRDAGSRLSSVAAGFCDAAHRSDAESFFTGRSTRYIGGPRVLKQTLERIEQCSRLQTAESGHIATFLKAY